MNYNNDKAAATGNLRERILAALALLELAESEASVAHKMFESTPEKFGDEHYLFSIMIELDNGGVHLSRAVNKLSEILGVEGVCLVEDSRNPYRCRR